MRTRLALALVLPMAGFALVPGCAPTQAEDREVAVEESKPARFGSPSRSPHAPPVRPKARSYAGPRPVCGELVLEPLERWDRRERLAAVRASWHPRAEYGRPTGIRRVSAPVSVPGYELWQVKVEHVPNELQPCWLRSTPRTEDDGWGANECVPAELMVDRSSRADLPRDASTWARLLGTFDDAAAVFASEAELDGCVPDLPPEVRAKVPPLGRGRIAGGQHVTFVEWIDVDDLSLLLTVYATLEEGRLDVERKELMQIDHRGGTR
ncbi:hypothetical protein [Paraliomyxa miuraensis]|uniref:hypothetical protein n=1 Tax=Paraliomyxa miuraensis TaxID=376150 RepID=UPI002250B24E|nr:hypothetical protein [Paraliomyxa miuraensis]MCX4244368.1 hypothetical protein [Paraliomyxa miuraensis]